VAHSFSMLYRVSWGAAVLLVSVAALGAGLPPSVSEAMAKHKIPEEAVSLYLREVSAPQPALVLNEQVPRNPASVIKLLTSLAALDLLGPGYTWRTEALIDGRLIAGHLDGNLILRGYGDPYLTPEALWRLLQGVHDRGLETISGNIVLDGSYFVAPLARRGDFDGQAQRAYNALPSALAVNFQVTTVHMMADKTVAGGVRVFTDPPLANLKVTKRIKLVQSGCASRHHHPQIRIAHVAGHPLLEIGGTFASKCSEASYARLILTPQEHMAGTVEALWSQTGGHLLGEIRSGVTPSRAKTFHSQQSRSLAEVLRGVNKWSNNLIARTLLLTMGAETQGAPATEAKGRAGIDASLKQRGLDFPELVIDNGSGLSRKTRISARSLGELLISAFRGPTMPEFISSMAVAGVDGTMRKRLGDDAVKGRAHIKTGSLNNVNAMAGYVMDQDGRRWVVALLMNHKGMLTWQGKEVQDVLLRWVYDGAGSAEPKAHMADSPSLNCGQAMSGKKAGDGSS